MAIRPLVVRLYEKRGEGSVIRTAETDDAGVVTWEMCGDVVPSPVDNKDFAVCAFLHRAMRLGRDLHIAAPVSRRMLENAEQYAAIWSCWRPYYHKMKVTADEEMDCPKASREGAVVAFSGGVDATFTVMRHQEKSAGRASCDLRTAILIHGFDIPLVDDKAFKIALSASRATLASRSIPVSSCRTDWKNKICDDWEMEFGAGLAAVMHQWSGDAGTALLGSDEDYGHLELPWGSNPLTIPYLSGDMAIRYDAGEFTRSTKIEGLGQWPEALANLRVCWQGPMTGRNCGVCEKCIRTKLNFLATGQAVPPALGSLGPNQIAGLKAYNPVQVAYLDDIVETALKNGIEAPWVNQLRRRIRYLKARCKLKQLILPTLNRMRRSEPVL